MKIKKLDESKSIKEGLQPADEWYLKVNPNDREGAEELKGLFIDDVIKDKGNLDKYGFSDRLKGILDNQFKRYSPVVPGAYHPMNEDAVPTTMTPELIEVLKEIAKLYKFFDYKKDVAKVKLPPSAIRQLHIFSKWYVEESNSSKPNTLELKNLAIQIANIIRTRSVVNESKSVKTLGAKGKKLNESNGPSQEQVARVKELVDDFKAYEGDISDKKSFEEWLKQFCGFTDKGARDILSVLNYIERANSGDLTESARPSQATLDDCLEYYLNNAFGYDGVEDYVDTEFPNHPADFKAEVVNYIKERKHLHEDATQYGVHQFSTDSIIFRGTEEECGEYIDNNQKLWDDAEVYRMEPGDPHYKKMNEASYGGAFDIEDDQYFTRDDLNSFADEVLGHISETFDGKYDIGGVWFENGNVTTQIVDEEGNEFQDTTHVDMRRIREPWHLKRMYAFPAATSLIAQIKSFLKDSGTITENAQGEGKYSDVFHRYLEWLLNEGHEDNIGYLASQLIRYCPEEDLKDLWYDRMEKVAHTVGYTDAEDQPVVTEDFDEEQVLRDAQRWFDVEIPDICKDVLENLHTWPAYRVSYMNKLARDFYDSCARYTLQVGGRLKEDLEDEAQKSQRYVDVEIPDLCKKVVDYIPNMSEGALIALNRHCLRWHSAVEDVLDNSGYYTNESLTEDVDVPTLTGPEEGPKSGVAALINEAIQEELKTVQMYNDIAVTARAEGFEDIAGQIDEINTEENKHIGQLQEVLKTVAPNAQAIDAGELEAGDDTVNVSEDTNNPDETPNTNIKEDVSMGKERWQDIYNSFKTVEKELNQDGEAVTAVVDKMYQDNKDDPDYKKAYDKWASGE